MSLIPFTPFSISAFPMSVFQLSAFQFFQEMFRSAPVSLSLSSVVAGVPPANVHHRPLVDTGVLPSISTILLHAVFPRLPDWVVNITRPPEQPFFGAKIEITHELELCLLFEITACRDSEL